MGDFRLMADERSPQRQTFAATLSCGTGLPLRLPLKIGFATRCRMDGKLTIMATMSSARVDGPISLAQMSLMPAHAPQRVILQDHARLPARFFGRLRASVQAQAGL